MPGEIAPAKGAKCALGHLPLMQSPEIAVLDHRDIVSDTVHTMTSDIAFRMQFDAPQCITQPNILYYLDFAAVTCWMQ